MSATPPLLGVLGGMGPLATADFLRKLAEETPAQCDAEHIPYIAWSVPQIPDRPAAIIGGGESPLPMMIGGVRTLRRAGATVVAIACNTAHHWHAELEREGGLPVLHIADAVCNALDARGVGEGQIGLIATEGTLQSGFFQRRFAARGLQCLVSSREAREGLILPAIAAVKANRLREAHALAVAAVTRLHEAGARAIVLACTETPVALDHAPHPVTVHCIDATRALARTCIAWHRQAARQVSPAVK
jgi:aspartate racemase